MKVNLLATPAVRKQQTNFTSNNKINVLILAEIPNDSFEKSSLVDSEESFSDDDILAGPFGHPYTGRPTGISAEDIKKYEENLSFLDWLFDVERHLYKRPKTLIEKFFSLGDNNFDDDVAKYQAQLAKEAVSTAKSLLGKGAEIAIPIGDLNGDGIVDKIVSGINRAIDFTGDGKADVIGTLIDVDGDGIADFVLTKFGEMLKVNGEITKVVGDSKIGLEDLKLIPEIISSLLRK